MCAVSVPLEKKINLHKYLIHFTKNQSSVLNIFVFWGNDLKALVFSDYVRKVLTIFEDHELKAKINLGINLT